MPWLFGLLILSPTLALAVEVHGHRGARARFPENTLPAFQHAIDVGVDYLELDLAVTKDEVLVVNHDPHINPKLCEPATSPLINELTLSEVKAFDCGSKRNRDFPNQELRPGTRIPTLAEVVELAKGHNVKFNIEAKIDEDHPSWTVSAPRFAHLVIEEVKKHGILDRVVFQSFDEQVLAAARMLEPRLTRSLLTNRRFANSVDLARRNQVHILSPYWDLVSESSVEKLHAMGVKVVPWTVNVRSRWAKLLALDVDGIITDDPEALIKYLKEKGLR